MVVEPGPSGSAYLGGISYTGGSTCSGGHHDLYALRINSSGLINWGRVVDFRNWTPSAMDLVRGGTATSDGGVVFVGERCTDPLCDYELYAVKMDANGNVVWAKYKDGQTGYRAWDVVELTNGDLVIVGKNSGFGPSMIKLTGGGNGVWVRYPSMNPAFRWYMEGITRKGNSDSIVVVGFWEPNLGQVDVFVGTYWGSTGVPIWEKVYQIGDSQRVGAVTVLTNGDILVVGGTRITTSDWDVLVMRLRKDGTVVWAKRYGTTGWEIAWDVTVIHNQYALVLAEQRFLGGTVAPYFLLIGLDDGLTCCFRGDLTSSVQNPSVTWSQSGVGFISDYYVSSESNTQSMNTSVTGCACNMTASIQVQQALTCAGQCNGALSVQVSNGSGSYTYLWSTGATTATISNLCPGTYWVRVQDVNQGCVATDTITLTAPPPIQIVAQQLSHVQCHGDSNGQIIITVTGGTPYPSSWGPCLGGPPGTCYQGSWSDGVSGYYVNTSTNPIKNRTNLGPGTYTIVITDANGCQDSVTFTINEPPPIKLVAKVQDVSCYGDSNGVIEVANVDGGTPFLCIPNPPCYQMAWSDGPSGWYTGDPTNPLRNRTNLLPDTYYVVITDLHGCTDTFWFVVNEPPPLEATLTWQHPICHGDSNGWIRIDTIWGGTPFPDPDSLRRYRVSWTGGANVGGYWPLDATNLAYLDSLAGPDTFIVAIMDRNECFLWDTIVLIDPPPIVWKDSVTPSWCGTPSGNYVLDISGGIRPYEWSVTQVSDSAGTVWSGTTTGAVMLDSLTPGTYLLAFKDSFGCAHTDTFVIPDSITLVMSLEPETIRVKVSAIPEEVQVWVGGGSATGFFQAVWNADPDTILVEVPALAALPDSVWLSVQGTGWVFLTVSDPLGCWARDSVYILWEIAEEIYIPNLFSPNGDGHNDWWTVFGPIQSIQVEIWDRWGHLVYRAGEPGFRWYGTCPDKPCNSGMYVYRVVGTTLTGKPFYFTGYVLLVR